MTTRPADQPTRSDPRPETGLPTVPGRPAPTAPRCVDGHCVTCSDEGIPMRVVSLAGAGLAICEDGDGARREILTGLVGEPRPGDVLLVHAGTALVRLDPEVTAGHASGAGGPSVAEVHPQPTEPR